MTGMVPFNQKKFNLAFRPSGFEDVYNMLDDFFSDSWRTQRSLIRDTFKIDVQEKDEGYWIEAELPGVKKEEISLETDNGRLIISIKRDEKIDENEKNYVHKERRYCSMQRSLYLKDANYEEVKAKLEDGVLNIQIPKFQKVDTTRKIEIE